MTLTLHFFICANAESSRWPPYVAKNNETACGRLRKPIIENRTKGVGLTRLPHEGKVDVQATFVVDEGGIADAVELNPITDILAQLEVARLCAIELI
jgi:hypothetical protein